MKIVVCKRCGTAMGAVDEKGNPCCTTCIGEPNSGVPVEVDLPDVFECCYCHMSISTVELLKRWKSIPFAEPLRGLYYCGCRGWD